MFDQVASAAAFRFLRQSSRPNAPRPVANSGRAGRPGEAPLTPVSEKLAFGLPVGTGLGACISGAQTVSFVVSGLVKIAVFDGRLDLPTYGHVNEFTVSEKNPGLLIIPPNLYHGWKNIGINEAIIINMPTSMYNYEAPDALDLPWDSEAAARIIPYRF